MALETPSWVNACFIEKVLRKSEANNSIRVIEVSSKPATNKGDNYTSDMFRVTVEFSREQGNNKRTEKRSVIAKLLPIVKGVRQDLIKQSRIFDTEILMMTDTLTRMNKLLGPEHPLSGGCLYVQVDHPTLLVMEDLAVLGFRMADRQAGLDLTHCILALRGLGRFHAASVAVTEKDPSHGQSYRRGIFNDDNPPEMTAFFLESAKALAAEVEQWPELGKRYSDKIMNFASVAYEKGIEVCRCVKDEFNVINHGDFWVNNMLFKYNDQGRAIDHIFVDFQLCVYTSPAIDLLYFLNTSPSKEVLENNKKTLLDEYLGSLSMTMKQLGCKTQPPTMEELKSMLKKRALYGMIASFTVLPLVICDKSLVTDLDEIMKQNGDYNNPAYKGELYRKVMTERIPQFDEWGLLDY